VIPRARIGFSIALASVLASCHRGAPRPTTSPADGGVPVEKPQASSAPSGNPSLGGQRGRGPAPASAPRDEREETVWALLDERSRLTGLPEIATEPGEVLVPKLRDTLAPPGSPPILPTLADAGVSGPRPSTP
jgi:hypothetical protein